MIHEITLLLLPLSVFISIYFPQNLIDDTITYMSMILVSFCVEFRPFSGLTSFG
jgi:hypothetical protein